MRSVIALLLLSVLCTSTFAKGGGHGGRSHMLSYGTGSKSQHSHVGGHTKRDGTYVARHDRSTPDRTKNNSWDTKGNFNPETGKSGTKRGDE
jgi:hypothetical protein